MENDPINNVDPLGLADDHNCAPGQQWGVPTGSHIAQCYAPGDFNSGLPGVPPNLGGGASGSASGYWHCTNCGNPAGTDENGDIVVPSPQYIWVAFPNFGSDFGIDISGTANSLYLSAGYSFGGAAGACVTGRLHAYIYTGITTPGPEVQLGYAPEGADAYVKGLTGSLNGMPGFGLASKNGVPTGHAWTIGTPFGGFTYSVPISQIISHFSSFGRVLSRGFYNMLGRPYGP